MNVGFFFLFFFHSINVHNIESKNMNTERELETTQCWGVGRVVGVVFREGRRGVRGGVSAVLRAVYILS